MASALSRRLKRKDDQIRSDEVVPAPLRGLGALYDGRRFAARYNWPEKNLGCEL